MKKPLPYFFLGFVCLGIFQVKAQCSPDITPPTVDGYSPIVNQENTNNTTCMAAFGQADLAQSFIPTSTTICGASIYITSGGTTPANITIALYDALPNAGGTLMASGLASGIIEQRWAEVTWSPVSVTPGSTYFLVFTSPGSNLCIGGSTNNPYPGGMVYANSGYSAFTTYDYTFQVFSDCPANEIEVCAGEVNYNLSFSDNCTTGSPSFVGGAASGSVLAPGTYQAHYSISDAAGNTRLFTLNIVVLSLPDATTTVQGLTISANNTSAGVAYQWVDCNNNYTIISGATGNDYTATTNGSYAVVITENGCADTSACVTISTVGLNELNVAEKLTIYPNPANQEITIRNLTGGIFEIINMNGQVVISQRISKGITRINLNDLANGTYSVKLITSNGVTHEKLIISK
ncbi:MAG: T9SS type A sorting domain-containing protein [Flavobacteriales bacterium]